MDGVNGDCFSGGHYADEEVFGVDDAVMNDGLEDLPCTIFSPRWLIHLGAKVGYNLASTSFRKFFLFYIFLLYKYVESC